MFCWASLAHDLHFVALRYFNACGAHPDGNIGEAHDPETGVILFDLLYGYAIHPDPVGAIEDALREVARIERDEGRHICLVASLCGTDIDPQNVAEQARRLREYGVVIQPSNARAALLAGLIVS